MWSILKWNKICWIIREILIRWISFIRIKKLNSLFNLNNEKGSSYIRNSLRYLKNQILITQDSWWNQCRYLWWINIHSNFNSISRRFLSINQHNFKQRNINKLTYRYPRGESYLDLISRIEPILYEIERSKEPVVVIAH